MKELARESIRHGLEAASPLSVDEFIEQGELGCKLPTYDGAAFVTLKKDGELRGCIGSLSAHRRLDQDIAENAFAAAFRDHRFSPLTEDEFADLDVSISVLTTPELITFKSEQDLVEQLRPGVDGLILTEGMNRGTFLPSVWENYPESASFLNHLKMKAGLPANYWSGTLKVERYETISW